MQGYSPAREKILRLLAARAGLGSDDFRVFDRFVFRRAYQPIFRAVRSFFLADNYSGEPCIAASYLPEVRARDRIHDFEPAAVSRAARWTNDAMETGLVLDLHGQHRFLCGAGRVSSKLRAQPWRESCGRGI